MHREGNPSDEPADIVVVRAGGGESVFNVGAPAGPRTPPADQRASPAGRGGRRAFDRGDEALDRVR